MLQPRFSGDLARLHTHGFSHRAAARAYDPAAEAAGMAALRELVAS